MDNWQPIAESISHATGEPFTVERTAPLAGGCINEAVRLEGAGRRFFAKLNSPGSLPMFEAETEGLRAILDTGAIRAPRPVCAGADNRRSWLVLEHIDFGPVAANTSEHLGEQLAAMHRATSDHFGWHRDNTIGSTPQPNTPDRDWIAFFTRHRLGHQLDLAERNGAPGALLDRGRRLQQDLGALFDGHRPQPSLLHGDLWGGNWAPDTAGEPVIFDPACYCGDREADLAMTELFGGFDDRFYHSYVNAWAIDRGYQTRKVLYNLYHVLNHFNLFGGGYAGQAQDMVDSLITAIS